MIVVSSSANDSRAIDPALCPELQHQINVFLEQFDGSFPTEIHDEKLELRTP